MTAPHDVMPQPEFPIEDLTEDNASTVDYWISNGLTVQGIFDPDHHAISRKNYHLTPAQLTGRHESLYIDAVHLGVSLFEAINAAVSGEQSATRLTVVSASMGAYASLMAAQAGKIDHSTDEIDKFRDELVRTADIITSSCDRFIGSGLADYALAGAAIERQLRIDSIPELRR